MKFKSTAIALAVAGAMAAPAAQADLYASARIGLQYLDKEADDIADFQVAGYASRFGMRSETDLGNGMTAFGRYEFSVQTEGTSAEAKATFPDDTLVDSNGSPDADSDPDEVSFSTGGLNLGRRHAYVGLKGDFGSLTVGQTYHTFYNYVVGPNDIPWNGSGHAMVEYKGRTSHTATYAGSTGAVSFGVSLVFSRESEEDAPDSVEVGASFGIGDMTLGVAAVTSETSHGSADTDDTIFGVALTGIGGDAFSVGLGLQTQDDDMSFLAHLAFGSAYLHIESLDNDASDTKPSSIALGYTQSLGRNTSAWYELHEIDSDDAGKDETRAFAMLKYDIE